MKSILYAPMLSVAAGAVLPAHAASFIQVTGGEQPVSPTLISVQQAAATQAELEAKPNRPG